MLRSLGTCTSTFKRVSEIGTLPVGTTVCGVWNRIDAQTRHGTSLRDRRFRRALAWRTPQAALASLAFSVAKAQSSHGVRASRSARSTVPPHQMRRPAGASR